MELKYRGVAYQTFPTSIKIEGKQNQICFRGSTYNATEAVVNLSKPSQSGMVYRGIKEGVAEERSFLGNKYLVNSVKLIPIT